MGVTDAIEKAADHPWITAGAIIGLYLLLKPSSGGGGSGSPDYSASIASQKIVTDANVALSGIAAQVAAVDAARITSANNNIRDLAIAAMGLEANNKALQVQREATQAANLSNLAAVGSDLMTQLYSTKLGYWESVKSMDTQIEAVKAVQAPMLEFEKFMAELQMSNAPMLSQLAINEMNAAGKIEFDLAHDEQETIRNLAWRQKQIAKAGGMFNLFGNLTNGLFGLASQGLSMSKGF